jgi:hypothetical protein
MSKATSYKNLYVTNGQKRMFLISPHWYMGIFSRGTGKTTKMQAIRSYLTAKNVPGGLSVFYNSTYIGAQQRTAANTIGGWNDLGLIEGKHFWKNVAPPKQIRDNLQYQPLNWKNVVTTWNSHLFIIGSNDRPGLVNSHSVTGGIFVDELREINEPLMRQDLYPAIRGKNKWGKYNTYVFSRTYTTDMPFISDDADWIFDFEKLMNKEQIFLIAQASIKVEEVKNKILEYQHLYNTTKDFSIKQKYLLKINSLTVSFQKKQLLLDKIRCSYKANKGSVYFDTGSFISNISILKPEYFFDNIDPKNPIIAKTSFLNIRPQEVENKFYSKLNSKHFINGHFDYARIEEFGIAEPQSKSPILATHIFDYNPDKEIEIEFDYGDMCSCSVSQTHGREERYLATFEVVLPYDIDDLINIVDDFLRSHSKKVINLYKDPSGNYMRNKKNQVFGQQTIQLLKAKGWYVIDKTPSGSINPTHDAKHQLINMILKEKDNRLPIVRIIRETNRQLESSLNKAPRIVKITREGLKEIHKDKSSEKKLPLEQKPFNSTDHSDHFDVKIWHKYNHLLPKLNFFM